MLGAIILSEFFYQIAKMLIAILEMDQEVSHEFVDLKKLSGRI